MSIVVEGRMYFPDGNPSGQFTIGTRETFLEATDLLRSYVTTMVIQGGTATYSKVHDEFKIVMPDGSVEYAKYPKQEVSVS